MASEATATLDDPATYYLLHHNELGMGDARAVPGRRRLHPLRPSHATVGYLEAQRVDATTFSSRGVLGAVEFPKPDTDEWYA